jgi:hypothetical protein
LFRCRTALWITPASCPPSTPVGTDPMVRV